MQSVHRYWERIRRATTRWCALKLSSASWWKSNRGNCQEATYARAPADDYDSDARPVDGDGDGTATVDIGAGERLTVTAPLPVAGLTHVTAGLVVTFTNTSSNAVSYEWDFGDVEGTSTAVNPTYTYATPGAYTVALTATCSFGCSEVYRDIVDVKQYYIYLPLVVRGYP